VSFVDAAVILAASPRPIRFVIDHNIFRIPILSFVFRTAKAIPIAPYKENPALLEAAYAEVSRALGDGELVGIFPEGQITRNGELGPFKKGIKQIVDANPVPVIPIALSGLWGSMFSRKDGPALLKAPRRLFSLIELKVGVPIPADAATPELVRDKVATLRGKRP
jgi:hypothetical protein